MSHSRPNHYVVQDQRGSRNLFRVLAMACRTAYSSFRPRAIDESTRMTIFVVCYYRRADGLRGGKILDAEKRLSGITDKAEQDRELLFGALCQARHKSGKASTSLYSRHDGHSFHPSSVPQAATPAQASELHTLTQASTCQPPGTHQSDWCLVRWLPRCDDDLARVCITTSQTHHAHCLIPFLALLASRRHTHIHSTQSHSQSPITPSWRLFATSPTRAQTWTMPARCHCLFDRHHSRSPHATQIGPLPARSPLKTRTTLFPKPTGAPHRLSQAQSGVLWRHGSAPSFQSLRCSMLSALPMCHLHNILPLPHGPQRHKVPPQPVSESQAQAVIPSNSLLTGSTLPVVDLARRSATSQHCWLALRVQNNLTEGTSPCPNPLPRGYFTKTAHRVVYVRARATSRWSIAFGSRSKMEGFSISTVVARSHCCTSNKLKDLKMTQVNSVSARHQGKHNICLPG